MSNGRKHLASVALAVVLLSGCAGLTYEQPTSGERARVRFVTTTFGVSVLRVYDGEDCAGSEHEWMRLRVGTLLTSSVTRLGMPLWEYHDKAAKEVYVAADKPVHAIFWGTGEEAQRFGRIYQQCGVPFSATFHANRDYEVKFLWHPTACRLTIFEIVRDGQGFKKEELARFTNRTSNPRSGCLAQFKRFRLD